MSIAVAEETALALSVQWACGIAVSADRPCLTVT